MLTLPLPARSRSVPFSFWSASSFDSSESLRPIPVPANLVEAEAALAIALRTITQQEQRIRQLESMVQIDDLTGLGNKDALMSALRRELALTRRDRKNAGFLILVQLNDIQELSQTHGRAVADSFMQNVAAALLNEVRTADSVTHLGKGLFAIVMPQIDVKNAAGRLARLEKALGTKVAHIRSLAIPYIVRVGFAFIEETETPESLLIAADARLFASKVHKG